MGEATKEFEEELVDYEEEEDVIVEKKDEEKDGKKGHYVGIHSSGFRDFILKPETLRAVVDCGFEHPSEGTTFKTYLQDLYHEMRHILFTSST